MMKNMHNLPRLILFCIIMVMAGCSDDPEPGPVEPEVFTVSFDLDYNSAPAIAAITVEDGKTADNRWPANPVRLGYLFNTWVDGEVQYTAATVITKTVTVKAKWSAEETKLADQPSAAELKTLFDNNLPGDLSLNLTNGNFWRID